MIVGELRNKIDKLWTEFWTGGITNPLTVIEQISFLMFSRLLDIIETRNEKKDLRLAKHKGALNSKRLFREDQQHLRWGHFKQLDSEEMLKVLRDEVFPHFKTIAIDGSSLGAYMKDAQLMIQKPSLLVSAVNMIDELPLTQGDQKGDLYEYLLSKLTTAGINGQFRTPRHIIRMMVEIADPKPSEIVGDPACGTAGFLVGVMLYLLEKYSSKNGIIVDENGEKTYTGDQLKPDEREHIQNHMFHGFDFDVTMLRISAMNLLLHGVESPDIHYQDTLSNSFAEHFPQKSNNYFDVVLANPPFKGSLDAEDVCKTLNMKVKTKKTELLFLALMLRMLKLGGRCCVIVPDGVLFGSSKAHTSLRQMIVDENQLEAVIKLPAGVFKPYAGVSTAVLYFVKGGKTKNVFFYDVQNDGLSLDDKRDPIDKNDIPDVFQRWKKRNPKKDTNRTDKAFFVPIEEIRENKYDLSINRYKEIVYEEVEYDPPKVILKRLNELEEEIHRDLQELEVILR
ncbi:MAG: SAM-dependent DNA methyltransferase [Candidatus Omnitrophota bacterium]|jgi:type I restriction enzyme M protein|nr:MAG: SAM-dependent DNA methyltransferase [Candidatus Omnitrophota bacterium]